MDFIIYIKLFNVPYMTQKVPISTGLPPETVAALSRLGGHIRIARKRRALTLEEMASRMFVTRKTLSRLEQGDPGVSLAVLASALWVLGLDKDLLEMAQPEKDKVGVYRERQRLPQRVRPSKDRDDLNF
jgi:transcriptional regulator with XRE-family HTH domain